MARLTVGSSSDTVNLGAYAYGGAWSVCAWVSHIADGANHPIFGWGDATRRYSLAYDHNAPSPDTWSLFATGCWSGGNLTWQASGVPADNTLYHVGVSYDPASTANDAQIYTNGVAQTMGNPTPSGTYTAPSANMYVGNNYTGTSAWRDYMAEFAFWERILTADEWAALGRGASPLFFPGSLRFYVPMIRDVVSVRGPLPTVSGGTAVPHPRIVYPGTLRQLPLRSPGFYRSISANSDDAYWHMGGTFDATLNIGAVGRNASLGHHMMLRFASVPIPTGQTISAAYLDLVAGSTQVTANVNALIAAEAADSPATGTSAADMNGRTLTTAQVSWPTIPSWTAGVAYRTPDIASVLQEIVDRPGWASGNAIMLVIKDNGSTDAHYRHISTLEHVTDAAPRLHVEYTPKLAGAAPTKLYQYRRRRAA